MPLSGSGGHVGGEDVVGVAVEVLSSSVVTHGGAGVSVTGGDLDVAEVDAGVEHRGDEGVAQHVRVHARHIQSGLLGQVLETPGRDVPAHASAVAAEQDRPGQPVANGSVDGTTDCWR